MLQLITRDFSQEEWNGIVSRFSDASFIQLWGYGFAKQHFQGWRVIRHIFQDNAELVGAVQALVRDIPLFRKGIVWANRAPIWQSVGVATNPRMFYEMLRLLRHYWVDTRGYYLRIAPQTNDNVTCQKLLQEAGFQSVPVSQWISRRIDLTASEAELRLQLEKKWRNSLKRAEREKMSCSIDKNGILTSAFCRDYDLFLRKRKFHTSFSPKFIKHLQDISLARRKMWIVHGESGSKSLGSILIGTYGNTAEYLASAITDTGRQLNAGQLFLWSALVELKKSGYTLFDIGGLDLKKTPRGVLRFKRGMNGEPYRLVGEFDAAHGFISNCIKSVLRRYL